MKPRRVVITGIGVVAPNGIGKEAFWEGLLTGRSGIKKVSMFDVTDLPVQIAGEIQDFQAEDFLPFQQAKLLARQTQFGIAASKMALEDSHILDNPFPITDKRVIIGTSFPNIDVLEKALRLSLYKPDLSTQSTNCLMKGNPFSNATEISLALGFMTSARVVTTSCTSGLEAINIAFREIQQDERIIALAGGTDGLMSPIPYICMCASGMLSKNNNSPDTACRPFDLTRDGGVMSEGAGMVLIESYSRAISSGRKPYGEILAVGKCSQSIDSKKLRQSFRLAMESSLAEAHLSPEDIDMIVAHAPGDPITDRLEVQAIFDLFGSRAYRIPIVSIKAKIGSPFAAAGVLQLVAGLLSLQTGIIPPTHNFQTPDPECDIDCVPNSPRFGKIETVMINSHGLGGGEVSVVVRALRQGTS